MEPAADVYFRGVSEADQGALKVYNQARASIACGRCAARERGVRQ